MYTITHKILILVVFNYIVVLPDTLNPQKTYIFYFAPVILQKKNKTFIQLSGNNEHIWYSPQYIMHV
jgi:hypothetical protein